VTDLELREAGHRAAEEIWDDSADAAAVVDPREPEFASGVLAGFSSAMASTSGVMRKLVGHAAAAAEDLNVEPFHGIIEVLQNADDLDATEVRIAIRDDGGTRKLLISHNGRPVTCHHVLAMVLPYLTTKGGDAEQKGRFGIGLKTLRRISTRMDVHCAPYHFSAEGMTLAAVDPAPFVEGIYQPATDTLLAIDLMPDFDPGELRAWLANFNVENLLFLNTIERLYWQDYGTGDRGEHVLSRGPWEKPGADLPLERRLVTGADGSWTVYRATLSCPEHLNRSHKATGATTRISAAIPDHDHSPGLFIGFRTRVPVSLPFSIDAQFDPSTAREGLIDNPWNRWLIRQCADVLSSVAVHLLEADPPAAWRWVPLPVEHAGVEGEAWPTKAFDESFTQLRLKVAEGGRLTLHQGNAPFDELSYESAALEGLLESADLETLFPDTRAVAATARDSEGRWRRVLAALSVSKCAGIDELIDGFRAATFDDHAVSWWIDAGDRLAAHARADQIHGEPCWLSDEGRPVSTSARGSTERPLVIGPELSAFARRWRLLDRLHPDYGTAGGDAAVEWLQRNAEVIASVDEAGELAAFAEAYATTPVTPDDHELREIRDRFDQVPDRRAGQLGIKVGRTLLLDAFSYKGGRRVARKASPTMAYLPRTLDGEYPHWPDAAASTPELVWVMASYDERLKTTARGRAQRRRDDGTVSRGPRKFLLLLGAASSPRVVKVGRIDGGGPTRKQALRSTDAEFVEEDFSSPDLERLTAAIASAPRKDRRARSAALIKTLSRNWPSYEGMLRTRAWHMALIHKHPRGEIDADWLCRLRDAQWVALASGAMRSPDQAVVRTLQTQAAYPAGSFIAGIVGEDVSQGLAAALKLITDVRASDLVGVLEAQQAEPGPPDPERALQAYRALAKQCPPNLGWNSRIGDISIFDLKQRFGAGKGLILVPSADGTSAGWRRPADLLVGRDVLHQPERFAPGSAACARLWSALGIHPPQLDDCIAALRQISAATPSADADAALIDIYRHMEPLASKADKRQKASLRSLPVGIRGGWTTARPVFRIDDRELRGRLSSARPDLRFWEPPCDVHALPHLTGALGLTPIEPVLRVEDDPRAREAGDALRLRFQACVDHLSNELARNDPVTRDKLRVSWTALREMPLSVVERPFGVLVDDARLSSTPIAIEMEAVLEADPLHLHIAMGAFPQRDRGGRAIAQLFAADARHGVEAEWVASWVASADVEVQRMTLASDEEIAKALAEQAGKIELTPGKKIKVSQPASRSKKVVAPRQLKTGHGGVISVEVVAGRPPTLAGPRKPLAKSPPPASPAPPDPASIAPLEYDQRDLEQHAWELLSEVLDSSSEVSITDFRRRHQVGADGAIDWTKFVELKATGCALQSSVEFSPAEFERAQEKGVDFILALVSGLERGLTTEIRLIFDPANRVSLRPTASIRLVGLADAPAVVVRIADEADEETIAA
jgi:hypothetical protein